MTSYLNKEKKKHFLWHICSYTHFAKSRLNQVSAFTKSNKEGKIRNRYTIKHQHLTQDTNERVTNSQLDITKESQEVPAVTTRHQLIEVHKHITNTRQK